MAISGYTNIDTTDSLTRQQPTIVSYLENDVARRAACSFATAWQAAQDFRLLREAKIPAS